MNSSDNMLIALHKYLKEQIRNDSNIVPAYVFGSHAKKRAEPHSDIDLGFLLDQKVYKDHIFEATRSAYLISAY